MLIALCFPTFADVQNVNAGQYNYFFNGKSLQQALNEFAKNNGLQIRLSKNIHTSLLSQSVTGRFSVTQIDELLNKLGKQYGFNWFIYSGCLYVTSNQNITAKINVAPQDMDNVKENLIQMGLYDNKFGYSELPAEDKLLITGPKEYIELVTKQIAELNISPVNQGFAVYRLKYANAVDMQFSFNNQQIIVPGVATILRGLLQKNQTNSGRGGANRINGQVAELIKNQNTAGNNNSGTNTNNSNSATSVQNNNKTDSDNLNNTGTSGYPLIEADDRLNTIVIRDKNNNLAIYKSLIDTLDVPAPLIQVEVMIIKLDQDKLNQAGINWWFSQGNAALGFGTANLNSGTVSNSLISSFNQVNPGQVIVTDSFSFANSLQFLEQENYAQTVAKPSLATIDNIPAIVTINKNYFYGTSSQTSNAAYSGMQITQALQITPHVIFEGKEKSIKLYIVLNDGSVDQANSSAIPSMTQSQINSQALLNEGQSVILAGYTKDVVREEQTKVPGVGDIPGLGWLFKTTNKQVHKEVTLYLVTPKIIRDKDTYKLQSYVKIGGNQISTKNDYQIVPDNSSSKVSASPQPKK